MGKMPPPSSATLRNGRRYSLCSMKVGNERREDRNDLTSGLGAVPPGAPPRSYVGKGYPLKASKRETNSKIRNRLRLVGDDHVDRHQVEAQQCVQPRCTNPPTELSKGIVRVAYHPSAQAE